MKLPRIAVLHKNKNTVQIEKDATKPLKDFFNVFPHDWLDVDEGLQKLHEKDEHGNYKYAALLMRPIWGGEFNEDCFESNCFNNKWNSIFQVATLSASDSKIIKNPHESKIHIINAQYGNIDSTAELAIWMAITLKRKLHLHCMSLAHGGWRDKNITKAKEITGLKGSKWAILGMGNLGSRVLARLPGLGISYIKVYYSRNDIEKFKTAIKDCINKSNLKITFNENDVESDGSDYFVFKSSVIGNPGYDRKGKPIIAKKNIVIEFSTNLKDVIDDTDVICVTLHPDLKNHITYDYIQRLKKDAILINISRAEVIDKEVYEKIFSIDTKNGTTNFNLTDNRGFGSDVLTENLEEKKKYEIDNDFYTHQIWAAFSSSMLNASLLKGVIPNVDTNFKCCNWQSYVGNNVSYPNVLLTPHVGGTTYESEKAVAEEVIGKLLENLGMREKYEVFYKHGKNLPDQIEEMISEEPNNGEQIIVLNDDERNICIEIMERGYKLENAWPLFVADFAEKILSIYEQGYSQIIFHEKISENKYRILPCDWKFEKLEQSDNCENPLPNCSFYIIDEKNLMVEEEKQELNVKFDVKNGIFPMLHKYTLNGTIALSDWVRFTLRVLHVIISMCEDKDFPKDREQSNDRKQSEWGWTLRKRRKSSDYGDEIIWTDFIKAPERKRRPN